LKDKNVKLVFIFIDKTIFSGKIITAAHLM